MANPKTTKAISAEKVLLNLDKISGSTHTVSVELTEDLRNGSIVKLGERVGHDCYKGIKPADLATDRLVLIAASILPYDSKIQEEDVVLKAGERVRAYVIERGAMITLTDSNIEGATIKGQYAIPAVGSYELKVNATKSEAVINFEIVDKEQFKGLAATVLEVI